MAIKKRFIDKRVDQITLIAKGALDSALNAYLEAVEKEPDLSGSPKRLEIDRHFAAGVFFTVCEHYGKQNRLEMQREKGNGKGH